MAETILAIERLTKRFGGLTATNDLSLAIEKGEVHAIIGPNGAGKTTLIAQLSGLLAPDSGRIVFNGKDVTPLPAHKRSALGLARSFQVTSIFLNFTAEDNVSLAVQAHSGHSFHFLASARAETALREPARKALARVGLEHRADVIAADLSHGEQRQLEIAMALATNPTLLLLDEPMAGMGPDESSRMIEVMRGFKGTHTLLLIEHDMDAVFALADRITVLVYGQAIATGTPDEIRRNEEVKRAYLGDEA
ncbi:MAG: ABC transporter ATP-binding protein [Rhodospirillaceae bacterium]|nr:ABC transporter ATP-binding protein [Rhodospirillaceae bacterium]